MVCVCTEPCEEMVWVATVAVPRGRLAPLTMVAAFAVCCISICWRVLDCAGMLGGVGAAFFWRYSLGLGCAVRCACKQYACGTWIANTPLTPTTPVIDKSITTIYNADEAILASILANTTDPKVCAGLCGWSFPPRYACEGEASDPSFPPTPKW